MRNKIIIPLLVIIVFLLAGLGWYIANSRQNVFIPAPVTVTPTLTVVVTPTIALTPSPTATPTPTPTVPPTATPEEVTSGFYQIYANCLKNPPPAARGQVSVFCQNNNPFGASNLAANLRAGGVAQAGADPVVCAQNLPQATTIGQASTNGSKSTLTVIEAFAGNRVSIKVDLVKEGNSWKVSNITCPRPP